MIRVAATLLAVAGILSGGGYVAPAFAGDRPQLSHGQLSDDLSSARRRPARLRIVVRPSLPYPLLENGAIYCYPPGNYVLGANGVLYGPYPIRTGRRLPIPGDFEFFSSY
jgi:hypothetical protein